MKYIHADCLRTWLKWKITTKQYKFLTVFSLKNVECELCKAPIPCKYNSVINFNKDQVRVNNEIINLLDFKKPDTNYILLEGIKFN